MNTYKSFYKTVGGGEGDRCNYPTRLDLYGKGCYYDCSYCYAKQMLNFRKLWHPNDVGVAPLLDVYRQIERIPKGSVVRLGGMTDCFQPIERKYHNTYNTIRALNNRGVHYLIVTKSDLIMQDDYLEILDKDLAHIQISIPTNNNKVLNDTDNAPNFELRKTTAEVLQDTGFDVQVRLAPFLYETANFNIINNINVDKCLVEFLRVKPSMTDNLKNYIQFKDFTVKEGGYRHLPLEKKLSILEQLNFNEITVCDDVTKHYNYFKNNINENPNDCCNLTIKED